MKRVTAQLDRALRSAEKRGRCLHPDSPAISQALNRRFRRHDGNILRPAPGLFVHADYWQALKPGERMLHLARAMQDAHPNRVFCHETAALAWGLPISQSRLGSVCAVTVGGGRKAVGSGVAWYRAATSPDDPPVTVNGLHVTSLARTTLDCLRELPFAEGLAVADRSLRLAWISSKDMCARLTELGAGQRGVRRAVGVMGYADARAESWAESFARGLIITQGFAMPELQREFPRPLEPSRVYRVDMVWTRPDGGFILGEVDGYAKYEDETILRGRTTARALADEQHRDAQLTLYEYPIMHISTQDLADVRRFVTKLEAYGVPRDPSMPEAIRKLAAKYPGSSISFAVMPIDMADATI